MKKQPTLSIIIVNWNSGDQLIDCINSIEVARNDTFELSEVVVVDNGSTDESVNNLEQLKFDAVIIKNTVNLGFAVACNQGAFRSSSDYILFLNPDTRLFQNSITEPVSLMERPSNANIGICGIMLVDANGVATTSAARFPTLKVMAGKILGLSKVMPKLFPTHLLTSTQLREDSQVDQVIGAFFLIRRNVFDKCEGFDERFFVYFEEVDLSLRAKQFGYNSYFLSGASAFHKGGGCSDQVKSARLFYSLRSRLQFGYKHYSNIDFVGLILLTGVEFILRIILGFTKASWNDICNTIIGYSRLVSHYAGGVQ